MLRLSFLNKYVKPSKKVRKTKQKRIAITQHGQPEAILLSYQDFIQLIRQVKNKNTEPEIIDFKKWDQERKNRAEVSRSIASYFDPSTLSSKGQKTYKKNECAPMIKKLRAVKKVHETVIRKKLSPKQSNQLLEKAMRGLKF